MAGKVPDVVNSFHDAVYAERVDAVECILKQGIDVDAKDDHGNTALMTAARRHFAKIVELLLDYGANPNMDNQGTTALHLAAIAPGPSETLRLLLENGAEVNRKQPTGNTALMSAAWTGDIDKIKALLAKGADVNVKDDQGRTAMTMTQRRLDVYEIDALLKEAGAEA